MSSAGKILTSIISTGLRLCSAPLNTASRAFHCLTTGCATATNSTSLMLNKNELNKFLMPTTSIISQVAGFKVKGRLRRRCKDCYFVMRQQRLHVICKTHPRHKQMAMKARDYKTWILTHATQSKIRPY